MHGFNVLVIKLVLLCGRHVSSGRPTGLIQNISNIKVKCLVEFLANLAKYCRNLDIITVTSTKIVDIAIRNAGIDQRIFDGWSDCISRFLPSRRTEPPALPKSAPNSRSRWIQE